MRVEALDRKTPRLICVATIGKSADPKIFFTTSQYSCIFVASLSAVSTPGRYK
jgi:mbt repeat